MPRGYSRVKKSNSFGVGKGAIYQQTVLLYHIKMPRLKKLVEKQNLSNWNFSYLLAAVSKLYSPG